MKKIFYAIGSVVILSTVNAQAGIFNWGITAGMNMTKADVESESFQNTGWNPDSESGWYAGIQFRISAPLIGIGADFGIVYDQETIKFGDENETAGYVSVPLNLRYDINLPLLNQVLVPYVFTGPKASYNVQKIDVPSVSLENLLNKDPELEFQNPALNFKTEDLVWHWHLGFGVILLNHLQVSYNYGFPLTKTASMVTGEKNNNEGVSGIIEATNNIKEDFNLGTHSIGVTLFF